MSFPWEGLWSSTQFAKTHEQLVAALAKPTALGGQLFIEFRRAVVADVAFGWVRPGQPMRREHLMVWLSMGKPVAAAAVLLLWERGAWELDDPVAAYLPEFAQGGKEKVTLRHLLTHTAGIRMVDLGWPERSWEEILAEICRRPLEPGWIPGRRAGYHLTSSWFVLGELIRRVDGRPYEQFVCEELFEKLEAPDCWMGMPALRWREYGERLAPMYTWESTGWRNLEMETELKVTRPSPGGNGWGPVGQFANFYRMLARWGELDGVRILGPQTVDAMVARHRVGLEDRTFRARLDWGLGVIVNSAHYGEDRIPYGYGPYAGPRTFGHSGAMSSVAMVDPDAQLVVVLAFNGLPGDELHRQRAEACLAAIYEDLGLKAESA
jgi:CubicO group peptidase (beta-lactamase class C family)